MTLFVNGHGRYSSINLILTQGDQLNLFILNDCLKRDVKRDYLCFKANILHHDSQINYNLECYISLHINVNSKFEGKE